MRISRFPSLPSTIVAIVLLFFVGCKIERVELAPEPDTKSDSASSGIDENTLRRIVREELEAYSLASNRRTTVDDGDGKSAAEEKEFMATETDESHGTIEMLDVKGSSPPTKNSQDPGNERKTVAFVTNGIASFWTIAEAGCKAAAEDLDCECLVRMPPDGTGDQKRMLEELINMKVDGIAVSPINPDNQADILNAVGESTHFITQDSDAPNTNRLAYIGMSNYDAGRMCGQLVKEAMPDGGEVIIFVGRLGQLNADLRRQGVIDELLDRDNNPEREFDPASKVLKGDKYTILDTRTDNFDFAAAKSQVEDAIARYPDVGCMVGLFAYNAPGILEAVRGADKLDKIKVVSFDEDDRTLQAIQDGHCYGTIVQNPYMYGYKSVEVLLKLAAGDDSVIPDDKFINIPARIIKKADVKEFWDELKRLTQ